MTPAQTDNEAAVQIVDELTYRSYWYQRRWYGVTAEQAALVYPDAEALEARYKQETDNA